jgi:NAD(P)H-hydrate epimerase
MPLPTPLYTAAQGRALDTYAIHTLGVPGYTLMKRAGEAALRFLRTRWPTAHSIVIVCGGGNNGGDGYVLARFAQAAGLTVTVLAATPVEVLRGDAQQACLDFKSSGGRMQQFAAPLLAEGEVIVDALLGTGLSTAVRPEAAAIIRAINASERPVFALDVPSGLDSDRGVALGDAVRATGTVCFIALKTGLFVGDGPDFAGNLFFDDLEVVAPATPAFRPRLERIIEAEAARALPPRARGEQGRLWPCADRRQRRWDAGGGAPVGRGLFARGRGARDGGRGAGKRGRHRLRMPRTHLSTRHPRRRPHGCA